MYSFIFCFLLLFLVFVVVVVVAVVVIFFYFLIRQDNELDFVTSWLVSYSYFIYYFNVRSKLRHAFILILYFFVKNLP